MVILSGGWSEGRYFAEVLFFLSEDPVAASYHLGPPGKRLDARPAAEFRLFTVNYS